MKFKLLQYKSQRDFPLKAVQVSMSGNILGDNLQRHLEDIVCDDGVGKELVDPSTNGITNKRIGAIWILDVYGYAGINNLFLATHSHFLFDITNW